MLHHAGDVGRAQLLAVYVGARRGRANTASSQGVAIEVVARSPLRSGFGGSASNPARATLAAGETAVMAAPLPLRASPKTSAWVPAALSPACACATAAAHLAVAAASARARSTAKRAPPAPAPLVPPRMSPRLPDMVRAWAGA